MWCSSHQWSKQILCKHQVSKASDFNVCVCARACFDTEPYIWMEINYHGDKTETRLHVDTWCKETLSVHSPPDTGLEKVCETQELTTSSTHRCTGAILTSVTVADVDDIGSWHHLDKKVCEIIQCRYPQTQVKSWFPDLLVFNISIAESLGYVKAEVSFCY